MLKSKARSITSAFNKNRCVHFNAVLRQDIKGADEQKMPDREAIQQERTTINEVIDAISNKPKLTKADATKLLNPDLRDKQTVFSHEQPSFTSLISASEHHDEKPRIPHSSIHMTVKDIRKMPISLTSFKEVKLTGFEQAINNIEERERLKVALEVALSKHLEFLNEVIKTDKDLLDVTQNYLKLYMARNLELETQPENFIDDIKMRCENDPKQLPQPYAVTLPAVIRCLFEGNKFMFPVERKYSVLFAIYNKCKSCKDLSMYLNVCGVDFYNLLISYSWANFQDPVALKRIIYEMDANGVHGDINTTEILQKILSKLENTGDSILDIDFIQQKCENSSILWCKENTGAIEGLNDYLANLKKSLT